MKSVLDNILLIEVRSTVETYCYAALTNSCVDATT
jgi:hypothetical protein